MVTPPIKSHYNKENKRRVQKLQDEAKKQFSDFKLKSYRVKVKIDYYVGRKEDIIDAESGIHDSLNKITFDDDKDIIYTSIQWHFILNDHT